MTGNSNPSLAFVFPGQGSQSVGMLSALAARQPLVQSTFDAASSVAGLDLWRLAQNGPEQELNQTVNTQPVLVAAGVAVWRVWNHLGRATPARLAGHSLGEYTALVCAGSLTLEDGIRLVIERARCMQAAVPEGTGAMAAVLGLDDAKINRACAEAADAGLVAPANINAPGQFVIAGTKAAVERAIEIAKQLGAKRAIALPVSVPSHCALMQDAAAQFARTLETVNFSDAKIPVIQNVDGQERTDVNSIREALIKQLYLPVQWVETVRALKRKGIRRVVECGPGRVLSGLVRRIEPDLELVVSDDVDAFLTLD